MHLTLRQDSGHSYGNLKAREDIHVYMFVHTLNNNDDTHLCGTVTEALDLDRAGQ